MVKIVQMLVPPGSVCRPGIKMSEFIGVTIHETANTSVGAGAMMHARYLLGTGNDEAVSWHYAVDDKLITQSIPQDECAWHSGDGRNGNGNRKTISIEICVNPDSDYEVAKRNAAELAAMLLEKNGMSNAEAGLFIHQDWSGKNCPARLLKGNNWLAFNELVQRYIHAKLVDPRGVNPDYTVFEDISGFMTAEDALNGTNRKTTVSAGNYFVYKEVAKAINVTKTLNTPGSWINSQNNSRAELAKIGVGDTVRLVGHLHMDSYGAGMSDESYDLIGKITKVSDLMRIAPYYFEDLGWVHAEAVTLRINAPTAFAVGDRVKIKQSASKYSRSTTTIPSKYKGVTYTIQQVGNVDVLLRELYSWVKKTDITKV